jgi:CubicO group peptidase (beta-lactamase class C family)
MAMRRTARAAASAICVLTIACEAGSRGVDPFAVESATADPSGTDETEPDDDGSTTEASDGGTSSETDGGTADTGEDPSPARCPGGDAAWAEVVAEVEVLVEQAGGVGAAIAVVCEGELVHAAGIGTTRHDGGASITPATRFQFASVTKMFTGAAAVALAEDGAVDLHAPVTDVLSGPGYGAITLHHLLTHTASYPTEFAFVGADDLLAAVNDNAAEPMWAPPGAVWNYSNPGFAVAGAVLQVGSGTPFAELVESRIFAPAGMTRATMHVSTVLGDDDYAWGHTGSAAAPESIAPDGSYYEAGWYGPMGGAWGSVEDLARWGEVHLNGGGDVMSAEGVASLGAFHTPTTDSESGYGYGLFVERYFVPTVLSHGGSVPGFLADWRIVPELGFGVFAVTNAEWLWPGDLADVAMERYAQLDWSDTPLPDPVLQDFVGTYVDPYELLGTIVIAKSGGELVAQVGGSSQPLTHLWADNFTLYHPTVGYDIDVTFWRNGGTQAQWLVSIWGIATRAG